MIRSGLTDRNNQFSRETNENDVADPYPSRDQGTARIAFNIRADYLWPDERQGIGEVLREPCHDTFAGA